MKSDLFLSDEECRTSCFFGEVTPDQQQQQQAQTRTTVTTTQRPGKVRYIFNIVIVVDHDVFVVDVVFEVDVVVDVDVVVIDDVINLFLLFLVCAALTTAV